MFVVSRNFEPLPLSFVSTHGDVWRNSVALWRRITINS